jgi:hypothetical protein
VNGNTEGGKPAPTGSSPDLLAALELALPYVQRVAGTSPTMPAGVARQRAALRDLATIRAAIAKVKGSDRTCSEEIAALAGRLHAIVTSMNQRRLPTGLGMPMRIKCGRFVDRARITLKPVTCAGPTEFERLIGEGNALLAEVRNATTPATARRSQVAA